MSVKAYAYIRVSGQGQVDGDGLWRQEVAIKRYAKANVLEVMEVFKDEGVSGTVEDRPALAKLMLNLEENGHGIKTVIIERLDRLARDLMVQEAIVRDLQKQGYKLISTTEGDDLCGDDATRKLIRQIFGAVAEYDKSMLVAKLRAARDRKRAKEGRCEGRKPYGETPEEQTVLRRMRAWRRRGRNGKPGRTYQEIADMLNAEGVKTGLGGAWSRGTVHQVLNRKK